MKGNPKLIEPLFTEHLCIQNEDWKKLKQVRDCIFSQVTINQYVGYSASKLGDYEKGKGEGVKNLYHTLRLIREAKRIALRQPPKIWMEGEERQYLLDIRQGKVSPDIVKQEFKTLQTEINSLINSFPPETDIHVLNKWLVELRMKGILPSSQRSLLTPLSNTNHSLKDKAQQLLDQNQVKGQILCVIPSGSRLYGTSSKISKKETNIPKTLLQFLIVLMIILEFMFLQLNKLFLYFLFQKELKKVELNKLLKLFLTEEWFFWKF